MYNILEINSFKIFVSEQRGFILKLIFNAFLFFKTRTQLYKTWFLAIAIQIIMKTASHLSLQNPMA